MYIEKDGNTINMKVKGFFYKIFKELIIFGEHFYYRTTPYTTEFEEMNPKGIEMILERYNHYISNGFKQILTATSASPCEKSQMKEWNYICLINPFDSHCKISEMLEMMDHCGFQDSDNTGMLECRTFMNSIRKSCFRDYNSVCKTAMKSFCETKCVSGNYNNFCYTCKFTVDKNFNITKDEL